MTENQKLVVVVGGIVVALSAWVAFIIVMSAALHIFGRWAANLLGWI